MAKFCPVCSVVLLEAGGRCPACGEHYDEAGLPKPDKFEVQRNLRQIQRIQASRKAGSGGGFGRLLGGLLRLGAVGALVWVYLKVDYRARPDLAGEFAAGALVLWFAGGKLGRPSPASGIDDKLPPNVDLTDQIARMETLFSELSAK